MTSAYLLRFDDLCPTLNWQVWDQVESLLLEAGLSPLMAVIPDNQDKQLMVAPPNGQFWDRVRSWQGRGWPIGLHGHQHRYTSSHKGLVGWRAKSEFAGEAEQDQARKLDLALGEFHRQGITADAWVAPGHTYDQITLRILRGRGLETISDGFSRYPYADEQGMVWVPQQLWRFRPMPPGVWTICLHINRWNTLHLEAFRDDLARYRNRLTSLNQVVELYRDRPRSFGDRVFSVLWRGLIGWRSRRQDDLAASVARQAA